MTLLIALVIMSFIFLMIGVVTENNFFHNLAVICLIGVVAFFLILVKTSM